MDLVFAVVYESSVVKVDIPRLSLTWKNKIKSYVEKKLTTQPEVFGKPLRKSLKGYRRLRVGDYRVVYRIEDKTVKVFAIVHRSVIYKMVTKRLNKT